MVEHEADLGVAPCSLDRGAELAGPDEQVVGEPGRPDRSQPALHLLVQEPLRISLVVDLMPHSDERAVEVVELPRHVSGEIHPADDPEQRRRLVGEGQ